MRDIPNKGLKQFELHTSEKLKKTLIENLRDNKKSKQVIQLNGKSNLLFANLVAITLASCGGGGGGGSSSPAPVPAISNASFTFNEDEGGTFSISLSDSSASVTLGIIPQGLTLTASDGTILSNGLQLTSSQLSNISFTTTLNFNGSISIPISASDGSSATITLNITAVNDEPTLSSNSFTFVEDTADSFIRSLKSNKIVGETINVGNNFEISIKDIIKIMREDFGYNLRVTLDKKRVREKKSEVYRLIASNTKAKKLLNWKPKYGGVKGFKLGLKKNN